MTGPSARRSYVVTGAAGGIGSAIVARLVASDALVVAVDREDPAARLADLGDGVVPCVGDVAEQATLERAAELAGRCLFGWVNNAAMFEPGAAADVDLDVVRAMLDVNLIAAIVGSQLAVRSFLANNVAGSIVNVSSIQGIDAFPGWLAYGVAKAGLNALARSIAVDYGGQGIRANAVAPGTIKTPLYDRLIKPEDDERIAALHARRRVGTPEEVAEAVAFLLSDASANINGVTLPVDGGRSIYDSDLPR